MRRLAATLLASLALTAAAGGAALLPVQRALLMLRVLAYDRALAARAGQEVRVAVAYRPGHRASEAERDAMLLAVREVAGRAVVSGLPVSVTSVPFESPASFRAALERLGPAALYVAPGLEEATGEVAAAGRAARALTFGASREQVLAGLAVALVDRGERAGLAVDARSAAEAGADLDAVLLSVAERLEAPREAGPPPRAP